MTDTTSPDTRSPFEQRLVDATPPADFPAQCIVVDHQTRSAPYYLRVQVGEMHVDHVELKDANGPAMSLPSAVTICDLQGHAPTHYLEIKDKDRAHGPWLIPTGIARRRAAAS